MVGDLGSCRELRMGAKGDISMDVVLPGVPGHPRKISQGCQKASPKDCQVTMTAMDFKKGQWGSGPWDSLGFQKGNNWGPGFRNRLDRHPQGSHSRGFLTHSLGIRDSTGFLRDSSGFLTLLYNKNF